MKRIIILTILALGFVVTLPAQECGNPTDQGAAASRQGARTRTKEECRERLGKHRFGLRTGLGASELNLYEGGMHVSDIYLTRVAVFAGFSYGRRLSARLPVYFETGLCLSPQGGQYTEDDGPDWTTYKFKLLCLEVPARINYHFHIARGRATVQPFLGLYYSLGVRGQLKVNYNWHENIKIPLFKPSSYEGEEIPQTFKRSDAGVAFGVAFNFANHCHIGVNYQVGLIDILKDPSNFEVRNLVTRITFGYNF